MKEIHRFSSFHKSDLRHQTGLIMELMRSLGYEIDYENNTFRNLRDNKIYYITEPQANKGFWTCTVKRDLQAEQNYHDNMNLQACDVC